MRPSSFVEMFTGTSASLHHCQNPVYEFVYDRAVLIHYGKQFVCRVAFSDGKGVFRLGKASAVWLRTAKRARHRHERQRHLCRPPNQICPAKALPSAFQSCRVTFLCREPQHAAVKIFFAVRSNSAMHVITAVRLAACCTAQRCSFAVRPDAHCTAARQHCRAPIGQPAR